MYGLVGLKQCSAADQQLCRAGRQRRLCPLPPACMLCSLHCLSSFVLTCLVCSVTGQNKAAPFIIIKETRSSSICLISPSKAPTSCDKWWFIHGQMVSGYTIMPWKQVKTNTWFEREKVEGKQLARHMGRRLLSISLLLCVFCVCLCLLYQVLGPSHFRVQTSN